MNKLLTLLLALCTIAGIAQDSAMSANEISELQVKAKSLSNSTTTLVSDFVQSKHLDFLDNDIITSGKLVYKAPNSIKWEYTSPFKYSVIFNNKTMKVNDGGAKSEVDLGSSKLFQELNELIVNSVSGNMFDKERFTMKYARANGNYEVTFIPKDGKMKEFISSFLIHFRKSDAAVISVRMIEPSGDYTLIEFSNRQLNVAVGDEVFNN